MQCACFHEVYVVRVVSVMAKIRQDNIVRHRREPFLIVRVAKTVDKHAMQLVEKQAYYI
jgi:hypothetical protein